MRYRLFLQLASNVLFFLCTVNTNLALAAAVPLVSQWNYSSPNNNDYRSFSSETMTINVSSSEIPFTTWSNAKYPANQDFTVSVDFGNYTTQGAITNASAGLHSDAHISIRWQIDEQTSSEVDIRRSSYNDGSEGFEAMYTTFTPTNFEIHQRFSAESTISSGKFSISKTGNSVTVSVKASNDGLLHTWAFDPIATFNQGSDIIVNLRTINGPRERTSVDFSNLDMTPVPLDINWTNVRNSMREGGGESNYVAFTMLDTSGNPVTSDVTSNVQLFGPSGAEINLASNGYYLTEKYLTGSYDSANGRWNYGNSFSPDSGYAASFAGDLPAGVYHLVITTNSGMVYDRYINYSGKVTLPIISSTSFYAYKDEGGNLLFSWKIPYDASFIATRLSTALRAWIDVYQAGVFKAEIWVSAPTHLGHIFVPASVVQLYEAEGTEYQVAVQLRTTDNRSRAYSQQVPLIIAQGPPIPGDVDGNGKVGLEEAINALKVVAGD